MLSAANAPELSQPSAAWDLTHDSFVRAFSQTARTNYDATREFGPYLYAIARNCVMDALRWRQHQSRLARRPEIANPPEGSERRTERWSEPEVVRVTQQYVTKLPQDLQDVYVERFVRGRSQRAASDALGITRRNLRTRERHLRVGLKKVLVARQVLP